MRPVVLAVLVIVLVPGPAHAQRGRAQVEEGNRLYRDGRYDAAHERYLDALRAAPGSGIIRFNDGNALYKREDFERAMEAYRAAVESGDPELQARAWYNLGNALYRQQQLDGALEAYKQALRLNPQDADAKHNLERVLQLMQQQQQQQQQQQGDDQNQDQSRSENHDQQQDQQDQTSQGEDRPEDQNRSGQPDTQPGQDSTQQRQSQPQPGRMSREEAERLLRAITEDPGKIQRHRRGTAQRRRPRKDW